MNGIPTIEVDGKPLFIIGAQCDVWRSTRQDAKTVAFFDGYRNMNATTVSVGVPWSKLEPERDRYDFTFLDWFIRQADRCRLKLVVNLFSTNICGKVEEAGPNGTFYPQYTPDYILKNPSEFQRMILPKKWQYAAGGPPMCPNDPHTLDREKALLAKVAGHLKKYDVKHTVVMLQLDNEFYYQQWEGDRPAYGSPEEKAVRCTCSYCNKRWSEGHYKDGQEFMFTSFADYVRGLTDVISQVYDLPLYLNSPWWNPEVIPVFLDNCPKLNLVGIDGIFSPIEPNILSLSQKSRNIPFAAENPTEQPLTRLNLDVLPYYTLIGEQGIGNLLWECGPPHTVVEDPKAKELYAAALYPLKNAMTPIAKARNTDRLTGWYMQREPLPNLAVDEFGNYRPNERGIIDQRDRMFIREGKATRITEGCDVDARLGDIAIKAANAPSAVLVRLGFRRMLLAVQKGHFEIELPAKPIVEIGVYKDEEWQRFVKLEANYVDGKAVFNVTKPSVIQVSW